MASTRWKAVLLVFSVLLCAGCGTLNSRDLSGHQGPSDEGGQTEAVVRPQTTSPPPDLNARTETRERAPAPAAEANVEETPGEAVPAEAPGDPSPEEQESEAVSNQELLDSALDFCQASNDYWERGDLENALDALDKAYALILKANMDDNPELQQQKEDLRITIAKRIMEVYASRFTVAPGIHKAIPLVMNDHVRRALASFTGREKGFFLNAYRRAGKYRPAIVKAFEEAGFPKELSWLPLIESGFSVRALSRARALGLWQFIASTGYKFGLKRDPWIDERMDPEKATQAAIAYLRELHQIFGDWTTVLAAYNCGERAVLNRIRTQKINYLDNFWDLYEKLPRETADYVPRFLAVLHILNDPAAYGIELPATEEALVTEEVAINKQVRLETIAKALDVDGDILKEMNPELRLHLTPNSPYALRVPAGTGEKFLAKIDDIQPWSPPLPTYVVHRVQKGDTLSSISTKYRTSVKAIMELNGLRKSSYLKVGWRLKVPGARGASSFAGGVPLPPEAVENERPTRHTVKRRSPVHEISSQHQPSAKELVTVSQGETSNLVDGQAFKSPGGAAAEKAIAARAYRVRGGDSPYRIAKKHQMSLADFLEINNLTFRSTIYPGQTYLVRPE